MKKNKEIKKELEQLAPELSKLKKENPYIIPHNYFKEMQDELSAKLNPVLESSSESIWDRIYFQLRVIIFSKPVVSLASLAVIILAVFLWNNNRAVEESNFFANLDETSIEKYIEENIEDFDSELFLDLAFEEGIVSLKNGDQEEEYLNEIIEDFEEEEIINLF